MGSEHLPDWVRVFRVGFAPQLSTAVLLALRDALERDDPRLIQGHTTEPPPLHRNLGRWVEGACAAAYGLWTAGDGATVSELEDGFAELMAGADRRLGGVGACHAFLNYWDDAPRREAVPALLAEVEGVLATRLAVAAG